MVKTTTTAAHYGEARDTRGRRRGERRDVGWRRFGRHGVGGIHGNQPE
jgi:hypothetical protein